MRWIPVSILFIALTVATAWRLGRPRITSITQRVGEDKARDDLDMARIRRDVRRLSSAESRVSGYAGAERAADYLLDELRKVPGVLVEAHDFKVAVPRTTHASITSETPDGKLEIRLYPLWPNLARTCRTSPSGITGPMIDVGRGTDAELAGKRIADSIVVMDWACDIEWLSAVEFGGKAVVFRGGEAAGGNIARNKFLSMPANIPRYYAAAEDLDKLDRILAAGSPATITCRSGWRQVTAWNILARVSSGDAQADPADPDSAPIVFHAYYDSISVVPQRSPGAEQACGAAVLLEFGRYFASHPTNRPVYLLFTGGHGQALSGMTHFVGRLRDGLGGGWTGSDSGSLLAQMGRPGLFVGLDLSTRSEQYGLFCLGQFRGQWEGRIRHKFSALGAQLGEYAKAFASAKGETDEARRAFVDCINLTMGRGWWTFFPYRAAFESEIPTMAGFAGVTLASLNDDRRYVDTPDDTFERLRFDLFQRQIGAGGGKRPGLVGMAEAIISWTGPFASPGLGNAWARLDGRVVWLDQRKNYTPNEPLTNAMVFLKTGRGDKYLMGTRGIPAAMTDARGRFAIDGLILMTNNSQFANCEVEAYGTADETFLDANATAMAQYRQVLLRGGKADTAVELDGAIVYAVDMARPKDFPWRVSMRRAQEHLNIVCFPCRAFSLLGLTDPRGYIPLKDLAILEAATKSLPFQFGQSQTDTIAGDEKESLVTLWANPTMRVLLTLGLGFQEKRLILTNSTPEAPEGRGFILEDLVTVPSMVLQGSRDMWILDESRIRKLERNGVRNPRIRQLHDEAKDHIDRATEALADCDYRTYRNDAEKGWALEGKAYGEVLATINNMIHGILFYLALLGPLSYCLERLLIASETLKKRLVWIAVIFAGSFAVLALVHPAFRFTITPLLVLLAFVILALVITVSVIVVGRVDSMLRERKQVAVGRHEEHTRTSGIAVRALDLGISNIRRRPQRGFLTGLTVVMVTFILLSFTSLTPTISISRLTHPDGRATYRGLLVRDRDWAALPNPLYDSIRRNFRPAADSDKPAGRADAIVAARAWFFSDASGKLSQIDLAPVAPSGPVGYFTAVSLVCMEPSEAKVTGVDKALLAGRWFADDDEIGVILSLHAARQLGYGLDDVGKAVRIFGQELPVVGIIDGGKFDAILDIDGEPLTPANFVLQQQEMAQLAASGGDEEPVDTLQQYVHYPSDQLAIVPFRFGHRLGATIRSIAVKAGSETDLSAEAKGYTKRSNLTILACDGSQVVLHAALNTSQMSAAWQIAIPVFLGFIMILGTMLGSVYERRSEIFVYSSVGLSPANVSSLFLAESSVYAIIGAGTGYLLGQVVSRIMQSAGLLSSLSLNYTAGATVLVTVVTMLIVVVSAMYPARKAYLAAIPDGEEDVETPEGESAGDTISMYLPFVAAPGNAEAMQAYMFEYLDGIQGVTVGRLAVDDLRSRLEMGGDKPVPLLAFRAWMAPFDLGISHDAELRIVYRGDRDVWQYHLTARRFSGDGQNWRRLTPRFILAIRKQLLMWRILSPQEVEKYRAQGRAMFGGAERDGDAPADA